MMPGELGRSLLRNTDKKIFPRGTRFLHECGFSRIQRMHWIIIEDSLESSKGHWLEYLGGFCRELPKLGDEVTLLVSCRAENFIRSSLNGLPVLPESAYNRMSDGAPAWRRLARVPIHAWKTFWSVRRFLKTCSQPDVVFVPTVITHHLLGWFWLIKTVLRRQSVKVLLFFPGLPIRWSESTAEPALDNSLTARLMRLLLQKLSTEIKNGKVVLGVETQAMKQAAEKIFGVTFTYFPHPVQPAELSGESSTSLMMACYGAARHEKGSDILLEAIGKYLNRFPDSRTKFVIQWLDNFVLPSGETAILSPELQQHPQVEIISRFFDEGEYACWLAKTDVMLLPYRFSSYGLRVSRVIIEALVYGIPTVVNKDTTLEEQAQKFGAMVLCEDGNVETLVNAIQIMEQNFLQFKSQAEKQKAAARKHFSVNHFRHIITRDADTL